MRGRSSTGLVLILTVLLAAAVMVGAAGLFAVTGWSLGVPPASTAPIDGASGNPTVYRNLTIAYDPAVGDFVYSQTQLTVPADVIVVFTIVNYDSMTASLPTTADAMVTGTMNDQMRVAYDTNATTVGMVPTGDVSHTFTMSDPYYQVNVPIPPAQSNGVPARVSFSIVFHVPGPSFAWGCVAFCGGPVMAGMYGDLSVVYP